MADDIFKNILNTLKSILTKVGGGGSGSGSGSTSSGTSSKAVKGINAFQKFFGKSKVVSSFANISKTSQIVGGLLSGLGTLASSLGVVIGAIGLTVVAFTTLVASIYKTVKAQLENQREIAKLNGQLANSFAVSDIQDILRNRKLADQTSESTAELNSAFTRLKDSLLPFEVAFTNLINGLLTQILNVLTPILDFLVWDFGNLADAMGGFLDSLDLLDQWVANLGQKSFEELADEMRKTREEERKEKDRDKNENIRLPAERYFQRIVNQDFIKDVRPPMFGF